MIRASTVMSGEQSGFSNGTHSSIADVPVEKGGQGQGFGPHELLEAALATCMSITVRKHAVQHGMSLESAECEVRADRSFPGRVTFLYSLKLKGPLSQEQQHELQKAASHCPVMRTLGGALAFKGLA